jgi:hypothetical protein
MDVLVMGVIPAFRDEVLRKFHQNVRKEHAMPIDPDIFAFYRLVKGKHPALVERLRGELELVRTQWLKNVGKAMNDRSRQKDDLTCSPSKRARRVSRQGTSDLVVQLHSPFNIRTMSTEITATFACSEEKLVEWIPFSSCFRVMRIRSRRLWHTA